MGICTNGDIIVELQNNEDANFVCDQMKNIAETVQKRMKYTTLPCFDIQDAHVDEDTFYCNVYSNRVQNGDFQIDQIVEQLKVWVKEKKILPPYEMNAELLVQHQGWSLEEDDFI